MRHLPTLFLLLFIPLNAWAQGDAASSYVQQAGVNLPFLRASLAPSYSFSHNGTYLADTLGFREGTLVYEGKEYPGLLLDLNAVEQHVLIQLPHSPVSLDLGQEQIDAFSRGDISYVNLKAKGYDTQTGFFELMDQGKGSLYRKITKTLKHLPSLDMTAERSIGYDDPHYKRLLADYFEYGEVWYLIREDGSAQRLRSKGQIKKARQYVHSHETH